jgi:uncharacterized membrane protein YgcG
VQPITVIWIVVFPIFMLCVANGWMLGAFGCFAVLFVGNLITIVTGGGRSVGYGTRRPSWDEPGYVPNDPFSADDDRPRRSSGSSSWSERSHDHHKSWSSKHSDSGGKSWKTEKSYEGGGGKFGGGGASEKW